MDSKIPVENKTMTLNSTVNITGTWDLSNVTVIVNGDVIIQPGGDIILNNDSNIHVHSTKQLQSPTFNTKSN